jgi:Protein of unknown function (DUF1559)
MPNPTSRRDARKLIRAPSKEFLLVLLAICVGLLGCFGYSILFVSSRGSVTALTVSGWHLKHIGLAVHNYAAAHHNQLPPAVVADKAGRPLYSWRVVLLPYFDEDDCNAIHKEFHLDEPWDSDHNITLSRRTPGVYRSPLTRREDEVGLTFYQAFTGPGTAFERPGLTWNDFPDGTSNTFLAAEAAEQVPWSKPADLVYDPDGPLPKLGGWFSKPIYWGRSNIVTGKIPGFNVCLADGSWLFIPSDTDATALRARITRNGGEQLGPP